MRSWNHPYRLAPAAIVIAIAAVFALLPGATAEAASATKSCVPSGMNTYACTFTIVPGVPTSGSWLVQLVQPFPGSLSGTPTVSSATGCTAAVSGGGTFISQPMGSSDYNVGVTGCGAGATVTILEMVTVTSSGQVCQRVWVNTASPFALACANVTYTPPVAVASASKTCTATSTVNVFSCAFTVTPAFPGQPGDIIHVNEPPGPGMTGPGTFTTAPTVASFTGCGVAPSAVLLSSPTSYHATVGAGGCPGPAWTVTFTETIAVTASGPICQSFYMVAAVPPATACGNVTYTPPSTAVGGSSKNCVLSGTTNVYNCTYAVTLTVPANAGDPWPVAMTGPGSLTGTPTVASSTGCSTPPVVTANHILVNNTTTSTYEATVGAGGCTAGAVVVFNETIAVTGDGQICQTVWVNPMIPGLTSCAPVAFAKSLTPPAAGGGKGGFAAAPNFGTGMMALAIFNGGTVADLEAATTAGGGSGVWVQDANGAFRLLIAGGPAFLRDSFASMFPNGFTGVTSVTVTRAR